MSTPCVIELRANEFARRDGRPHVPFSPAEITADAVAAEAAGAAIFHWHARDPETGRARNELGLFAEVARAARAQTDLLLHPTLGYAVDQDPASRVSHVVAMAADPATRVDLAPIDMGSMNLDAWDARQRRFLTEDRMYLNPRSSLRQMLETFSDAGVTVISVCWNAGQIRTARCFREMGLLGPTYWQLAFTGDIVPEGTPPTRKALEAMVELLPEGEPWSVVTTGTAPLELAGWAIELGGHVSTGLGDWGFPELGTPTNTEVVAHVAGMIRDAGRTVATPAQARDLLGIAGPRLA